jgi:transcriptional regulator with XRE-family HTH domain
MPSGARQGQKKADAGDAAVGPRIRAGRDKLGLSQTDLANQVGVTFQQIQKYENNTNRVSIGRLARIAKVLGVSTTFLLTGSEEKRGQRGDDEIATLLKTTGALQLMKAFDRIEDRRVRHAFVGLVERAAPKRRQSSA